MAVGSPVTFPDSNKIRYPKWCGAQCKNDPCQQRVRTHRDICAALAVITADMAPGHKPKCIGQTNTFLHLKTPTVAGTASVFVNLREAQDRWGRHAARQEFLEFALMEPFVYGGQTDEPFSYTGMVLKSCVSAYVAPSPTIPDPMQHAVHGRLLACTHDKLAARFCKYEKVDIAVLRAEPCFAHRDLAHYTIKDEIRTVNITTVGVDGSGELGAHDASGQVASDSEDDIACGLVPPSVGALRKAESVERSATVAPEFAGAEEPVASNSDEPRPSPDAAETKDQDWFMRALLSVADEEDAMLVYELDRLGAETDAVLVDEAAATSSGASSSNAGA